MATVREGQRSVLLVVDVQVGVMKDAWQAPRVVGKVARLVDRAREQGAPVLWVQHADEQLVRDSGDWQWVPELVPAPGEARIHKAHNSSFERTALDAELARLGATHIVLAGAASNWCIRATAYAALERGYDLTLVGDAHTTETMVLDDGQRVEAAGIVQDLNLAMTWLSYPGRRNATVDTGAVVFEGAGELDAAAGAPGGASGGAPLTADAVLAFLHRFEELAAHEDFDLLQDLVHDNAVFRFNDGDFVGKASVRGAFEKTWKGSPGVKKDRFYLSDIRVLSVDVNSASATYTYHWEGSMDGRSFHIQGRGTRVLLRTSGRLQIVHEHLSRFPAA